MAQPMKPAPEVEWHFPIVNGEQQIQADTWDEDLQDFRRSVDGEGSHAGDWENKPHRLVFDLCQMVHEERLERARMQEEAAKESMLPIEILERATTAEHLCRELCNVLLKIDSSGLLSKNPAIQNLAKSILKRSKV